MKGPRFRHNLQVVDRIGLTGCFELMRDHPDNYYINIIMNFVASSSYCSRWQDL